MGSGAALMGGPIYVWPALGAVLPLLLRQCPIALLCPCCAPAVPLLCPCRAPAVLLSIAARECTTTVGHSVPAIVGHTVPVASSSAKLYHPATILYPTRHRLPF